MSEVADYRKALRWLNKQVEREVNEIPINWAKIATLKIEREKATPVSGRNRRGLSEYDMRVLSYSCGEICSRCGGDEWLLAATGARQAKTDWCSECYRAERKEMTPEQRDARRVWKGLPAASRPAPAACECCDRPQTLQDKALALDHDHVTGAFRGWLCSSCNRGIGLLKDNLAGLRRAVAYLERVYGETK